MNNLKYFKPLKSAEGIIYSLDMVRLNFDFGKNAQHFVNTISRLASYDLRYEVKYFPSYQQFKYRHLWVIYSPIDDNASLTIGLDLGGTHDTASKGFIEFNPNKVASSCALTEFLRKFDMNTITRDLIRYDLAIDIPCTRSLVRLERFGRKGYNFIDSGDGITEYLGQKNSNGYIKLYDKTKESKLDNDLTRLEITLDKKADVEKVFPIVRLSKEQLTLDFDNDLTDNDKVLVTLIKNSDNPQFYLSSLTYRKRKKIEPYLADTTLLLDKKLALSIKTLAMSFERSLSYWE